MGKQDNIIPLIQHVRAILAFESGTYTYMWGELHDSCGEIAASSIILQLVSTVSACIPYLIYTGIISAAIQA